MLLAPVLLAPPNRALELVKHQSGLQVQLQLFLDVPPLDLDPLTVGLRLVVRRHGAPHRGPRSRWRCHQLLSAQLDQADVEVDLLAATLLPHQLDAPTVPTFDAAVRQTMRRPPHPRAAPYPQSLSLISASNSLATGRSAPRTNSGLHAPKTRFRLPLSTSPPREDPCCSARGSFCWFRRRGRRRCFSGCCLSLAKAAGAAPRCVPGPDSRTAEARAKFVLNSNSSRQGRGRHLHPRVRCAQRPRSIPNRPSFAAVVRHGRDCRAVDPSPGASLRAPAPRPPEPEVRSYLR
mmetsp:Transcript_24720/g.62137  ORF Transcript_24720/g.62137 Transcript_24720/m.62137 type:complete len:291 (-) Transcript_24720:652-1524(-)